MLPLPTPHEAWLRLAPRIQSMPPEQVPLASALDCCLVDQVVARWDQPRADVSAMDGYACAGEIEPGDVLREVVEIAAGDTPDRALGLGPGAAAAIMTGGWVPEGADRVIPFEATTSAGSDSFRIDQSVAVGANIRRRGEVLRAGASLLEAGTVLAPVHLSLAASQGFEELVVTRRPRAGFLVTGSEVLAPTPEVELPPGSLFDSHTPMLTGLFRRLGIEAHSLGVVGDRVADISGSLDVDDLDLIVTTGGVSAGRHDQVPAAVEQLGFDVLVHKVAMQPGKPVLIAVRDNPTKRAQWVVGLPGNPAAVLVGFHVFVAPLLRRLGGVTNMPEPIRVWLTHPVRPHTSRVRYLPAAYTDATRTSVRLRTPVGSHDLGAWGGAEVLAVLPPGTDEISAGSEIAALSAS